MILSSKIKNRIIEIYLHEIIITEYKLYRKGIYTLEEYEVRYKMLNELLKHVREE